jgi:hypothetical protein
MPTTYLGHTTTVGNADLDALWSLATTARGAGLQGIADAANALAVANAAAAAAASAGGGYDPINYGADRTGAASSNAAFNTAIALALANHLPVVVRTNGDYLIDDPGLTIPDGVAFIMSAGATLVGNNNTGTTITFSSWFRGQAFVNCRRKTIQWRDLATDTSSKGVVILNCNYSQIDVGYVSGYWLGLEHRGTTATGCAHNTSRIGRLESCKRLHVFTGITGGFANQNTFLGGEYRLNSTDLVAGVPVVGSRYLDLSTAGDGNTWYGTDFEDSNVEKNIECAVALNFWYGCRWENVRKVHFTGAVCYGNAIIGGYANPGYFDGTVFVDDTGGRCGIMGGLGQWMATFSGLGTPATANNTPALRLRGFSGEGSVTLEMLDYTHGSVALQWRTDGKLEGYANGDDYAGNKFRSQWDFRNGAWKIGDGTVAGGGLALSVKDKDTVLVSKNLELASGVSIIGLSSSGLFDLADAATTVDYSKGPVQQTHNTAGTTITAITNGTARGQRLLIMSSDGNTTIQNNANIVTKGRANIVMLSPQTVEFCYFGGGVWNEIA